MAPSRDREIDSEDYHDYVIRDGELVGAFEQMYRNCEDPWHQDEFVPVAEDIALTVLERTDVDSSRILDIGCGTGRFTSRLADRLGADVVATDISRTAVSEAQTRHDRIGGIAAAVPPIPVGEGAVSVAVLAELFWYVLDDIDDLFEELRRVLTPEGRVLIVQQFYDPGEQSYGNEVMEAPEDLLTLQPFLVESRIDVDPTTNHKLVVLLKVDE